MNKDKFVSYLWIAAIALAVLGIVGHYQWVIIVGVSSYNFEYLLIGFILILGLRLFKK